MSDLQRSFAKAQLARLPPDPVHIIDEQEEEDTEDVLRPTSGDSSSSASSTGTIRPSLDRRLFERPKPARPKPAYEPLPWQDFFARDLYIEQQTESAVIRHHIYLTPPSASGPLFVLHHGAGSSGLSFAAFSRELLRIIPDAGVLSPDCRYHGQTTVTPTHGQELEPDFSLSTLTADLLFTIQATLAHLDPSSSQSEGQRGDIKHDMVLIGHSLGGAVAVNLAHTHAGRLPRLLGYTVLDVVEGSAIDALQHMESYLSTRPQSFPSITSAIEWHIRSRTIRNPTSARVSVPALLRPDDDPHTYYTWRTPLLTTKPFWQTWFKNLSTNFLSPSSSPGAAKLLILAGTDRLDKPLMIGQMQGKYQLHVIPDAGHFVHEDEPGRVAEMVEEFWRRNDRSAIVLPMKVDEMVRLGKMGKGTG